MSRSVDIVVVGAGPAGLAGALHLKGLGHDVLLVAPAAGPTDERTSALLGGSVQLLERIGAWQAASVESAPLRSLRIADGTKRLFRAPEVIFHADEIGLDAFGHNLPNRALVAALEAVAAGTALARLTGSAASLAVSPDRVTLRLAGGEEVVARLVVAADGRNSLVRNQSGITTREWRYDQSALVLNFRHARPHDETSTEFHTEHGPFTIVPLPGERSSLVWVDRPEETTRRLGLDDAALAGEVEARSASILGRVTIDGRRQAFPLSGMTPNRFVAERVALIGEAAHVFPPIGAQGLNLGYRDVTALGEVLAGASDPGSAALLAAYERARRGDVFLRTTAVDALNRTLLNGFLPVQAMRGLGLFLLDRVPPLRRAVMRQGVAAS
ncbi:MAG: UbiH/UbiF family hydroxylase [Rhizobiales bacterium]|nr:UbiH/UbiF family hydroxylase [Hyphomicrobiales bacterium]